MRSCHLGQESEYTSSLVDDIQELFLRPDASDNDLVAPLDQTSIRVVTTCKYSYVPSASENIIHDLATSLHKWDE